MLPPTKGVVGLVGDEQSEYVCPREFSRVSTGYEPPPSRVSTGYEPPPSRVSTGYEPPPSRVSTGYEPPASRVSTDPPSRVSTDPCYVRVRLSPVPPV